MSEDAPKKRGWEKWHDWQARTMQPIAAWYCDAVAVGPGSVVLDTACGTGVPSLALAERVGPRGKVVATDVSADMLAAAQRIAAGLGVTNIEHRVMDVAALTFDDASFRAVTCKDGLMFCADPSVGMRELHRVLAPDGRFAVSAWDEPARAPFFDVVFRTLARFVPRPPPEAGAAGPFRLARPGELERLLLAAGFRDVIIERRDVVFEFDSLAAHWEFVTDLVPAAQTVVTTLPKNESDRFRSELEHALQPYVNGDRVAIPNATLCASGFR